MQILSFSILVLLLNASPGLNEINPCYSYNLFEVDEDDTDVVLSAIKGVFEEDDWQCRSNKNITIRVNCERGENTMYTKAICETAIPNKFRFYFVIQNDRKEILVDSPGEVIIPGSIHDSNDALNENP